MSPQDPHASVTMRAENRMSDPWNTPEMPDAVRHFGLTADALSAAHVAVGELFGKPVGEMLTSRLSELVQAADEIESAADRIEAERQRVTRELHDARETEYELGKALDVETMLEEHRRRWGTSSLYSDKHPAPTVLTAAEHNRDERVRLFTELEAARKTIQEMSDEQDSIIMDSANEVHALHEGLAGLVREGKITRARRNKIIRESLRHE